MRWSFSEKSRPISWLPVLRRLSLLHEQLKGLQPVRVSDLAQLEWYSEVSRRQWTRELQLLTTLGAPLVYDLEEHDAIYQYTEQWDLWEAVRETVESA